MLARWILLALAPLSAFAQIQLVTFDGTVEKAVGAATDLGTVAAADAREIRFRAHNTSTSPVVLTKLTASGTGFTITSAPSLQSIIAPSNFIEFRVHFSATGEGSYSAPLTVNTAQTLLRATVVPAATVSVVNDVVGSVLTSDSALDFGRVQKGKSSSQTIRIGNGTNSKLTIQSCAISGAAFHAPALQCPIALDPGAAATIIISFDPATASAQTGTLLLDNRSFTLTGVGFDPPLPKPSIAFESPLASGTQQRLSVKLAATAESSGMGTVTMDFQPAAGTADDPAIRFTGSGARNLSFNVNEGDQAGAFPAGVDTVFQTGTTAGTIVFRVKLGDYNEQFSFAIGPAAVSVDHTVASRRVNDLDVSITGFDNTRTAGRFAFTFFDKNGQPVQPGAVRADWRDMFTNYYRSSKTGGSFTMRATFPVTGDATQIAGVEVEMTNDAGTTRTTRVSF